MSGVRAWLAMTTAALVLSAGPLGAQGLASPGPLSSAHARLDAITKCLACHEAGRGLSGRRCLDCHAALAARILAGEGYHAVATRRGTALACGTCHSEHNGRPFRLVRWQPGGTREQFDHRDAGWPLEGAHPRQRCEACHRAALVGVAAVRADSSLSVQRTYLGLGTTCASCHLDEHRGRTSNRCEDCHNVDQWKPAPRFDHDRTRFSLQGRHRDVPCARCHEERHEVATGPGGSRDTAFVDFRGGSPAREGAPTPRRAATAASGCATCHTSRHRESARMGRCESCHTAEGWFALPDSLRHFDHTAIGFPLRGAHATSRCESCHLTSTDAALPRSVALVRANFVRPFSRQRMQFARCDGCHVDPHRGELAARTAVRDCDDCHEEAKFTPTRFSLAMHDSTPFPLTGAHAATPCLACHPPLPGAARGSGRVGFRHPDRSCAACHTDPHGAQFAGRVVPGARGVGESGTAAGTRCEACHETEAWRPAAFDHDGTRYPLRGAHGRLTCARCHTPPPDNARAPVRFAGLPLDCAGCHTDPHGGQFAERARGAACTTCHTDTAWRSVVFDHQRDSDFPLDGAHQPLACTACHKPEGQPPVVRFLPLPHRCEDCHRTAPPGGRS